MLSCDRPRVRLEIVVPVYNEEAQLAAAISSLCAYLEASVPYAWSITIADNASTDRTLAIATTLARDPRIHVLHLAQKGRGRALKAAWLASDADIVGYMDVDLSTGLSAFLPLIAPLVTGEADLAIGSRLRPGAIVTRHWKREILSRGYNALIAAIFRCRFTDAQCGFKALTRRAVRDLVPDVADGAWFFDTELLLLAEARGYRIHEVAVEWVEDRDSRVALVPTIRDDLAGLWRMWTCRTEQPGRQSVSTELGTARPHS